MGEFIKIEYRIRHFDVDTMKLVVSQIIEIYSDGKC